jgi:hypothetical protein
MNLPSYRRYSGDKGKENRVTFSLQITLDRQVKDEPYRLEVYKEGRTLQHYHYATLEEAMEGFHAARIAEELRVK